MCKTLPNYVAIALLGSWLFIFLLWLWRSSTFFPHVKLLQAMFIKLLIVLQVSFSYFRLCSFSLFFPRAKFSKFYWCSSSLLLILFFCFRLWNSCVLSTCEALQSSIVVALLCFSELWSFLHFIMWRLQVVILA